MSEGRRSEALLSWVKEIRIILRVAKRAKVLYNVKELAY